MRTPLRTGAVPNAHDVRHPQLAIRMPFGSISECGQGFAPAPVLLAVQSGLFPASGTGKHDG